MMIGASLNMRPWGDFYTLVQNKECTVKILTLNPYESTSLQRHKKRDEMWYLMDDIEITLGSGKSHIFKPGQVIHIPRNTIHRATSIKPTTTTIVEVSIGDFREDDIERIEDRYGRT
jgi:mannose-6-phosphate isomerase-like protein (cupin superfamily)